MSVTFEDTAVEERRGNKQAVPDNIMALLTQDQSVALRKIENFGWQLAFMRQPLFESPVTVVRSPDGKRHAVLLEDGELDMAPPIQLRH